MNKQINIGWAQTDITPQGRIYVEGQLFDRISTYVHDPLTATCLVLENGDDQITMVSLDMPSIPGQHLPAIKKRLHVEGLDVNRLVFCAIHTHNSTMFENCSTSEGFRSVLGDITPDPVRPDDMLTGEELKAFFVEKMAALITDAWEARKPGGVSTAHDYAAVAFNRRPQFLVNGKVESKMYGACSEPNFLGFEGSSDHSADMLYTWDLDGSLTGAAVCIPCPSQVYELHNFLSADYWGETRSCIREALGNIYVLPMCGAAGDQNPLDLVRISKDNVEELKVWNAQETAVFRAFDMLQECRDIGERICEAVVRGYRKARNQIETRPVFRTNCFEMDLPLRKVDKADVDAAQARIDAVKARYAPGEKMTEGEMIRCFEDKGYIQRWELQQTVDRYEFPVCVFRIGKAVLATNPFELYVDYSYRMKARTKARQVFIVQLCSPGGGGYLPTRAAVAGGSYGSKPVSTKVGPEGGDELVEKTLAAMDALF